MLPEHLPSFRARQRGGLTIIMALVLVGVLGAATFSLSRSAIRELSMAGTIIQGNKASAAADAGLDWVITWGQGYVSPADFTAAGGGASTTQMVFLTALKDNINLNYQVKTLNGGSVPSMTLNRGGAANTDQNFDLEVRFLGPLPAGSLGGGSSNNNAASGNTNPMSGAGIDGYAWRILATGHATPKDGQTYQAQRELVATVRL